MEILPILQNGDPVLRARAETVGAELFGTEKLKSIIENMLATLDMEKDGVALAGPQVNIPYRIFVVRYDRMIDPKSTEEPAEARTGVYINPTIMKASQRQVEMSEGCLSVRKLYGTTLRHNRTTVKAQDEHGTWFTRGAGDMLAQAFQHEIDHLDGILFIDHAEDVFEQGQQTHDTEQS